MATTSGINGTTGATSTPQKTSGTTGLTSKDFMNLMINQLQHQDPMNPTDSNALLGQIAQISTLQSNQTLQASLSSLTLQQSIGAGGNLIGKSVNGLDTKGDPLQGLVTGVKVENEKVYLTLNNNSQTTLPMENLITITQPVVAATTPAPVTDDPGDTQDGTQTNTQDPGTATNSAASDIANAIMNVLSGFTS